MTDDDHREGLWDPERPQPPHRKRALPKSRVSVTLWLMIALIVAAYVLKLPTYQTVYGSFAVVPVFLLWIYCSWVVTLAAALVAASLAAAPRKTTR